MRLLAKRISERRCSKPLSPFRFLWYARPRKKRCVNAKTPKGIRAKIICDRTRDLSQFRRHYKVLRYNGNQHEEDESSERWVHCLTVLR